MAHYIINVKTHINSNNETDILKSSSEADYSYKNGVYYISYSEPLAHNLGDTVTTIEVNGNKIILKRDGEHAHALKIFLKETTLNEYATPHGSILMLVDTLKIRNELSSNGGLLYFKYMIKVDNQALSENEVYINIRRK